MYPKETMIRKTYQRPKRAKMLSDSQPEGEGEKEVEMKEFEKENRPDPSSEQFTGMDSITRKSVESGKLQEDNLDDL